MNKKTVYAHFIGRKIKFNFRYAPSASVAGQFEQREHDGVVEWHWHEAPGLGHRPTDKWLYDHCPQEV